MLPWKSHILCLPFCREVWDNRPRFWMFSLIGSQCLWPNSSQSRSFSGVRKDGNTTPPSGWIQDPVLRRQYPQWDGWLSASIFDTQAPLRVPWLCDGLFKDWRKLALLRWVDQDPLLQRWMPLGGPSRYNRPWTRSSTRGNVSPENRCANLETSFCPGCVNAKSFGLRHLY